MDHPFGYDASGAVESAREKITCAINARHGGIVFTSSATESDSIALIGTMENAGIAGIIQPHVPQNSQLLVKSAYSHFEHVFWPRDRSRRTGEPMKRKTNPDRGSKFLPGTSMPSEIEKLSGLAILVGKK